MKTVEIYTDGACKGNPGPGGWDSSYVKDGITKWVDGWKRNGWQTASKKPVRNADLWHELIGAVARHTVEWHWVKGHAGHPENERADRLASNAAEAIMRS